LVIVKACLQEHRKPYKARWRNRSPYCRGYRASSGFKYGDSSARGCKVD